MIRPIESQAVNKNEPYVVNKLIRCGVAGVILVRVGLGWVGRSQLALDGRKVHRVLDDRDVVRDVKCKGVDRAEEGASIFGFLQIAHSGLAETELRNAKRR